MTRIKIVQIKGSSYEEEENKVNNVLEELEKSGYHISNLYMRPNSIVIEYRDLRIIDESEDDIGEPEPLEDEYETKSTEYILDVGSFPQYQYNDDSMIIQQDISDADIVLTYQVNSDNN